jgi:hypothetical protein
MGMRMASVDCQHVRPGARWRPLAAVVLLACAIIGLRWKSAGPNGHNWAPGNSVEPAAFFEPPSVPEMVQAEPLILARRSPPHELSAMPLVPLPPASPTATLPLVGGQGPENAALLPPQSMPAEGRFTEWSGLTDEYDVEISTQAAAEAVPQAKRPAPASKSEADAAKRSEQTPPADLEPIVTGTPTSAVVDERAQEIIRRGFSLAQRGASFAARNEFIDVLKLIAEAKDEQDHSPDRSRALAQGLRALDEVEDFAPRIKQPESNLSLAVILASHRTPAAKDPGAEKLMPQQLADRYFRYAQRQLAESVAGEPAGSMALHALGKLYSQFARTEADKHPLAERKAFSLQQAALLARDDNHLAAHELGVLLAESGHYAEAEYLLNQVAVREPHPVVFRNLARVERKLGHAQLAGLSEQQAQFMLSRGASGNNGVVWVSPEALAQAGDPLTPSAATNQVAGQGQVGQQNPATAPAAREPMRDVTRRPGGPVLR